MEILFFLKSKREKKNFCLAVWHHTRHCVWMQLENNSNGKSVISRQCAIDFPPIRIGNEILLVYYYIINEVILKRIIISSTLGWRTGSKPCADRSSKKPVLTRWKIHWIFPLIIIFAYNNYRNFLLFVSEQFHYLEYLNTDAAWNFQEGCWSLNMPVWEAKS